MRPCYVFRAREKVVELGRKTQLMGVVNITPDSFSDGGCFLEHSRSIEHSLSLVEAGADILDLGAESSRPGAKSITVEEELNRLLPVLQEVRKRVSVPISVDTSNPVVAREALREGADIVNDITAFRGDSEMPTVVNEWDAGVVLTHMRGIPETMQERSFSEDILKDIQTDLQAAVSKAFRHWISRERIVIDPGIGFGKSLEDNCRIVNRLSFLKSFQLPILIGTSRKQFLGKILDKSVTERMWGTAASVAVSILRGVHIIRVHDIVEMNQVALVTDAIIAESVSR